MKNKHTKLNKSEIYRGYFFTNMYVDSLQKGLQTAHCVSELFIKYDTQTDDPASTVLRKWAENDKTIIILNGGNHFDLQQLNKQLSKLATALDLPNASFREDGKSLNKAMTAVGLIVPDTIYEMNLLTIDDGDYPEKELRELLSKYRLAH